MSMTLVEALQKVDLEAGRTYHCQVNDRWIEVRVLAEAPELPGIDIPENDIMLDAWTELPRPPIAGIWHSRLVEPPLPDVPSIPSDEDEP
jgi:hypothetical protein